MRLEDVDLWFPQLSLDEKLPLTFHKCDPLTLLYLHLSQAGQLPPETDETLIFSRVSP